MKKFCFGIIGAGWRSRFFITVAKQMPEQFGITGVLMRDEQKAAAFSAETGVKAFTSFEQFIAASPEFVVVALPRSVTPEYLQLLMKLGMPVLCETPPAWSLEELEQLWRTAEAFQSRVQVAEQYFARPMIAAQLRAVELGLLGEVSFVEQSVCHGYHGINLIRRFLNAGFEECEISGQRFSIPATRTCTRAGDLPPEQYEVHDAMRDLCTFSFGGGKTGVYDFSGEQYRSFIRHSRIQVLGRRGEIIDDKVYWLSEEGIPASGELTRMDLGVRYNIDGYCNRSVMLGERELYKNPFMPARMGDDEIAIAYCLKNMGQYAQGAAEPFYPLREALQDTYLALRMDKALETGERVHAGRQIWG